MKKKYTVLVDFDGVIHRYLNGWSDGTAYDVDMPGSWAALQKLSDNFKVVIFSTRPADQIKEWWKTRFDQECPYEVTDVKRPALVLIDDRAIRFESWEQAMDDFDLNYAAYRSGPLIPRENPTP